MKQREISIHKIHRTYRINPSEELQKFWKEVENRKLNEDYIPFHYYKFKLFSLEQVADFNYKDIKFWFKTRGEHFLVRYYIPIATTFALSSAVIVAAYDASKNYIGVFLVNQRVDPIFLCSELSSLLEDNEPSVSKEDFIKEQISEAVIHDFDFDQHYPPYDEDEGYQSFTDEEIEMFFNQRLTELLKFLELVYNCTHPDYKLSIKTLKKSFKLCFTHYSNPKMKAVKPEIEVPKSESSSNQIDTVIAVLNRLNFQKWSESDKREYGLYRLGDKIVMLHINQLCEFVRLGIVPHFANVEFPSIVYSTHPSGFEEPISYEIRFFETEEEYAEYYKQYKLEKDILSIRELQEKDISTIVNYFLNRPDDMLAKDGFDTMKIPFEEELIEGLQTSILTKKQQHNIILREGGKAYGHCAIERFTENGEGYLYFYDWNGLLKRERVIDGLLKIAIAQIIEIYSLKTIYVEPTKEDEYRNGALKRAGFELVKEDKYIRDAWSGEKVYNLWKLDCGNNSKILIDKEGT